MVATAQVGPIIVVLFGGFVASIGLIMLKRAYGRAEFYLAVRRATEMTPSDAEPTSMARITGTVESRGRKTTTPKKNRDVEAYKYTKEKWKRTSQERAGVDAIQGTWSTVEEESDITEFALSDGDGAVLVDADSAKWYVEWDKWEKTANEMDIELGAGVSIQGEDRFRMVEQRIEEGDELTVFGRVAEASGGSESLKLVDTEDFTFLTDERISFDVWSFVMPVLAGLILLAVGAGIIALPLIS